MSSNSKKIIVIPAYNEEETIREVVTGAIGYADICVVDDASKDKTPAILLELQKAFPGKLHVILHEKNTHIPGGIQDGMKFAVSKNYDFVVTMDAGLSHDPAALEVFFANTEFDLVIGKREKQDNVPLYRKIISWLAARVMNYCLSKGIFDILGPNISDCTSGYRMYSQKAFAVIANAKLESVAFDFHMEALYLTYKTGGKIKEIPIHYKFSNSSFNRKVLKLAINYAWKLLKRKYYGK